MLRLRCVCSAWICLLAANCFAVSPQTQGQATNQSKSSKIKKSSGDLVEGEIADYLLFGLKNSTGALAQMQYEIVPGKSVESIDENGVSLYKDARCIVFGGLGLIDLSKIEDELTLAKYAMQALERSNKSGQLPSGMYLTAEAKSCTGPKTLPLLGQLRGAGRADPNLLLFADIEVFTGKVNVKVPINEIVRYWETQAK